MIRSSRTIAAAAIAGLAVAGSALPHEVAAHAYLVRSSPSHRAVLARAPARVNLWFNERLEPAYSTVSVTASSGERVDDGAAAVSSGDPRRLSVTLRASAPGDYQVRFRILSVDSHVVEGTVAFTLRGVDQRPR